MKSLRQLYKIGSGPSSSHTMGPEYATRYFLSQIGDADSYKVILYGSLALTGKGHQTDVAILKNMGDRNVEVVFDTETAAEDIPHVNTMEFIAYKNGEVALRKRIFSVGGGDIRIEGEEASEHEEVYKESSLTEIIDLCNSRNIRLSDYVFEQEDDGLPQFLLEVWQTMKDTREDVTNNDDLDKFVSNARNEGYNIRCNGVLFSGTYTGCYVCRTNFACINFDGKVYKCTACSFTEKDCFGELMDNGEIYWNVSRISKLYGYSPLENPQCMECKHLPICLGPCPKHYMNNNHNVDCVFDSLEREPEQRIIDFYEESLQYKNIKSNII